jgi:mono/diheme cytochrome c family protein
MRILIKSLTCVALLLGGHVTTALAAGDSVAGKAMAQRWCSSCHLVAPEQATATTEAPAFATIAGRHPRSIEALAAFLADPHPPMPQMSLTRQEISDLLAYISSLK